MLARMHNFTFAYASTRVRVVVIEQMFMDMLRSGLGGVAAQFGNLVLCERMTVV